MGETPADGGTPPADPPAPPARQFSIDTPDEEDEGALPATPIFDDAAVPSVTGEGTMSDGKGNLKKVLFLSGGDAGQPPEGSWISRRASAAQASLQKMMKKKTDDDTPPPDYSAKAAELAAGARKSAADAAEATRRATQDASAKLAKLMGSAHETSFDESGAMAREDGEQPESRLDKLKAAFKGKEDPAVSALREEVGELRAEVARLAARVEEISSTK